MVFTIVTMVDLRILRFIVERCFSMKSSLGLDLGSQGFKEVVANAARFGSYHCSPCQSSDF